MSASANIAHAQSLADMGRGADAVPLLMQVLAEEPDHLGAHRLLAYVHVDDKVALEHATTALRIDPNGYSSIRAATWTNARVNNHEQALKFAEQLVSGWPASSDSYYTLAYVHLAKRLTRKRNIASARDAIAEAIRIDPTNSDAWFLSAQVERMANKPKIAEQHVRQSLELDPSNADSLYLLSSLQSGGGRVASAMDVLRGLIAEDPSNRGVARAFDDLLSSLLADLLWLLGPTMFIVSFIVFAR